MRVVRPLDVDAPAYFLSALTMRQYVLRPPPTAHRPYWIAFFTQSGVNCLNRDCRAGPAVCRDSKRRQRRTFCITMRWTSTCVRISGTKACLLASYTWSHTIDNTDPDSTSQNPNDPNQTGAAEYGNALYDQRNRFVLSGFYIWCRLRFALAASPPWLAACPTI